MGSETLAESCMLSEHISCSATIMVMMTVMMMMA